MSQASPTKVGLSLVCYFFLIGYYSILVEEFELFSSFDFTDDLVGEKLCIRYNKDTYTFALKLMSPLVFLNPSSMNFCTDLPQF